MTAQVPDLPTAPACPAEWWRGAVVYQVYPRSFADTDGDGVGDLNGITARLDHIASLGVDPVFGTLADFDRLIARAHALGLRIITDLVLAHTSDQHSWFRDSRQGARR